jgi:O-antigen/teichoic acid export membrane protein
VASNLSGQLLHWASLIIIPTAAIMALPALFKRDVGHALVTLVIVVIVGMFAFDPHGVQNLVEAIAKKVLG